MSSYGDRRIAREFLQDSLWQAARLTIPSITFKFQENGESEFFPVQSVGDCTTTGVAVEMPRALAHHLKGKHMHRKSLVLTVAIGLSLAVFATDAFAQRGGRGRGGRGGAGPSEDNSQTPGRGRGRSGGAQAGGRFGGTQSVNPLFAALDANSDGVITTAEMEDAIQAFAKLDENKDGKLTVEEAGAARGGGHGHAHGRGAAAGGSSQAPAAGRGGRGRRGGAGAPAAGRGGRGRGGQGASGAGRGGRRRQGAADADPTQDDTKPAKPPAGEVNSKSPFDK